jgi:hypothetical protein
MPLHINPFAFLTCPFVFGCATDANFNFMPCKNIELLVMNDVDKKENNILYLLG